MNTNHLPLVVALIAPALLGGCTASGGTGGGESRPSGGAERNAAQSGGSGSPGGKIDVELPPLGAGGASTEEGPQEVEIVTALPAGFTAGSVSGGWKVLGDLQAVELPEADVCANLLHVLVRDIKEAHPDFQQGMGHGHQVNMVERALGADKKPILADPPLALDMIQGPESFAQWYNNDPIMNATYLVEFWLEPVGDTFVFDTDRYFPVDNLGFAEMSHTDRDGTPRNFHLTTELHTQFEYKGGEAFTFRGDDDVWVFINNRLAIDLGGLHQALEGSVVLDDVAADLGIEVGGVYDFDLFHAERQTAGSNFRMETTLDFSGCSRVLPTDIVR